MEFLAGDLFRCQVASFGGIGVFFERSVKTTPAANMMIPTAKPTAVWMILSRRSGRNAGCAGSMISAAGLPSEPFDRVR